MTEIAIDDLTPRNRYVSAGGETTLDYDFPIFDADHLLVQETDPTDLNNPVTLVRGTDYTVTGVGVATGGTIVFDTGVYPSGGVEDNIYTITRNVPYERLNDYQFSGDFESSDINSDLDLVIMQIQQLDLRLNATVQLDETDELTTLPITIEATADRQNRVLGFNAAGTGLLAGPTFTTIEGAATSAAAAAASATAAAGSATAAASSATSASGSATAAASSASAAATSETNAGNSETAAAASETAAAASETAAAASETAAAASETAAAASESAAATSESNAATSETNAAASASAAATSETNAGTSETNAAASAAAAAAAAAEGLYNDVVTLTNADSPYVPSAAEEGTLFRLDMTSGAITINLSALSTYGEDMKFGFVKVDAGGNSATINRGGSDTISGSTSVTLSNQYETHVIVGDSATGTWIDTVQTTGIADNSVTNAKLADVATQTIKGRNTASTGDPEDLSVPTVQGMLGIQSGFVLVDEIYYTAGTTAFTKATYSLADTDKIQVIGTAGGGGGGKASTTFNNTTGGCGAAGATFKKWYTGADLSASENFVIGAAGTAGTSTNGGAGGNTTFKSCTANGGAGGLQAVGGAAARGGTATGGDENIAGGDGGAPSSSTTNGSFPTGTGGASIYGNGGGVAEGSAGQSGQAYGSGGGAGARISSGTAQNGAAGAAGYGIIRVYRKIGA